MFRERKTHRFNPANLHKKSFSDTFGDQIIVLWNTKSWHEYHRNVRTAKADIVSMHHVNLSTSISISSIKTVTNYTSNIQIVGGNYYVKVDTNRGLNDLYRNNKLSFNIDYYKTNIN